MTQDGQQNAVSLASADTAPGNSVGGGVIAERYELRDLIGRGAFGTVHEVYDRSLGRLAALKTVPIGPRQDATAAEDLRSFHQEAQAVARLSHPGIVTVHDFGETENSAWIVMELVIGETLKAVLDRKERLQVSESVRVVCDLLAALHYAHERGIVHRDVKPANILLGMSAEDGLGQVRLADFGIAKIGDQGQAMVGQMIGTPSAMAPEQLRGDPVDRRVDLWAAGVILYEMLTGRKPFAGSPPALFTHILTHHPAPPSSIVPSLPPAFDQVIAMALAKAPEDRFPDAVAMAAAIRDALMAPIVPLAILPPLPGLQGDAPLLPPPAAVIAAGAHRPRAALGLAFAAGLITGAAASFALTGLILPANGRGAFAHTAERGDVFFLAELPVETASAQGLVAEEEVPSLAPEPIRTETIRTAPMSTEAPTPEALPAPETVDIQPAPSAPSVPPSPALAILPIPVFDPAPPTEEAPVVALPRAEPALEQEPPTLSVGALPLPPPQQPQQCAAPQIGLRSGSHPDHGRLVFDWRTPMGYAVARAPEGVLLRFLDAPCQPRTEAMALPRNITSLAWEEGTLRIATVPRARLRHYRLQNRIVIDVMDP